MPVILLAHWVDGRDLIDGRDRIDQTDGAVNKVNPVTTVNPVPPSARSPLWLNCSVPISPSAKERGRHESAGEMKDRKPSFNPTPNNVDYVNNVNNVNSVN